MAGVSRRVLLAFVASLVTGVAALTNNQVTVLLHGIGGLAAVAVPGLVAYRTDDDQLKLLTVGSALIAVTGFVWTIWGRSVAVVLVHVLGGIAVTAGVGLSIAPDPDRRGVPSRHIKSGRRREASMFRRLRETGPVLLVPGAWLFIIFAHTTGANEQVLLIAHVIITALLVSFVGLSWAEMETGVLRVWRTVILLGIPITATAVLELWLDPMGLPLLEITLAGWMLLPAVALARTGPMLPIAVSGVIATVGGGIAMFGAILYGAGWYLSVPRLMVAALAIVGLGQTMGIADAVYRY